VKKEHVARKMTETIVLFFFFQQYRSYSHVDQQIHAGYCSTQYRSNRSIPTWIRSRRSVTPFFNVEEIFGSINGSIAGAQGEPP
jgi:hypothetical protein